MVRVPSRGNEIDVSLDGNQRLSSNLLLANIILCRKSEEKE